jgi:hypothetical protein
MHIAIYPSNFPPFRQIVLIIRGVDYRIFFIAADVYTRGTLIVERDLLHVKKPSSWTTSRRSRRAGIGKYMLHWACACSGQCAVPGPRWSAHLTRHWSIRRSCNVRISCPSSTALQRDAPLRIAPPRRAATYPHCAALRTTPQSESAPPHRTRTAPAPHIAPRRNVP